MAPTAEIVALDRARAGRQALRGAFPEGLTRRRLLAALDHRHDRVVFDAGRLAAEYGTARPVQHLLTALGGGWSAQPGERPGLWVFTCHIATRAARARITGAPPSPAGVRVEGMGPACPST